MKNIDKNQGILDLFYKFLENCLFSDLVLVRSQIESDIKYYFYQKALQSIQDKEHQQNLQEKLEKQKQEEDKEKQDNKKEEKLEE